MSFPDVHRIRFIRFWSCCRVLAVVDTVFAILTASYFVDLFSLEDAFFTVVTDEERLGLWSIRALRMTRGSSAF